MIRTKRYDILGLDLALHSDCETFLKRFDLDYAQFAHEREPTGRRLSVSYLEHAETGAVLSVDGASRRLGESPSPAAHAYQMVTAALMKEIRGFFIIHGGVVAHDDQALVISGPSGSGKTTLVSALLEAGFQFLSDDFCPLDEATRLVHPFPRTMWRVSQGEELIPPGQFARHGKTPVALRAPCAQGPYKVGGLISIDPGPGEGQWSTTRVQLERKGDEVLTSALAGMSEVTAARLDGEPSRWEIRYRTNQGHARQVLALLKAIEPYTLAKSRVDSHSPDFSQEPVLTGVPCHEMAHMLLKEMKSDPDDLHIRPGRHFMKLAALLADIPCWRLTTGKLDRMKDLAVSTLNRAPLKELP